MCCGTTLVLKSREKLGFYGTYLGDHCGIYMKEKITSFPFNVVDNPMYFGSSINMIGAALLFRSGVGVVMGFVAMFMYYFWVYVHEERFTS